MKAKSVDNWVVCLEKKWKYIWIPVWKKSEVYAILNNLPVVLEKGESTALKLDARDAPTAHRGSRPWGKGGQTELSKKRSAPTSYRRPWPSGQGHPKDSKWTKYKLNFSRVSQIICWKHWRAARSQIGFFSVSHSSLSSLHPQVDFVLVTNSDKIRHGRVIDCPDLIFLVNNLQPQFLWLKRITPKKVFFLRNLLICVKST